MQTIKYNKDEQDEQTLFHPKDDRGDDSYAYEHAEATQDSLYNSLTRESVKSEAITDPITSIGSAEDLATFRNAVNGETNYVGQTVTLTTDITVDGWDTSISINNTNFLGTFDGQGHVITLTGSTSLFGPLGTSATVQNLGVKVTITTTDETSSTAGIVSNNKGTIKQCYTEGTITNSEDYSYAGGIVGQNIGTIQDCYSTVSITVKTGAGGIAQINKSNATIERCYATGAITGGGDGTGGIAGSNKGSINNCIALNTGITGNDKVGRISGGDGGTLTGNYATPFIPGTWEAKEADSMDGEDLTKDNFIKQGAGEEAFTGWSADNWDFGTTANLPQLKTTGLETDMVIEGQSNIQRGTFLNLPVEISTTVAYNKDEHKDKDILVTNGGIFTVATDDASFKTVTIEEGGQVVAKKAFTCKQLLAPRTLSNKWTAYGSPVDMKIVTTTEEKFWYLFGYDSKDQQLSSRNGTVLDPYSISTLNIIATQEANDVPVTLTAPIAETNPVTIPADAAPTTGEALYTGIFLFCANPTLHDVEIPVAYILNDDGTRFERTENAVVKPFQSYMVANAVTSKAIMSLRAGGTPTANEPAIVPDSSFRLWGANGQLHLSADKPQDVQVYHLSGSLLHSFRLDGSRTLTLGRGIYLVHSNNITYKVSL